ncbi:MAG: UvrB/UvrC motif-containing protein [Clostridia bacterium]|nr:UvrB/UvrC motif-containing protein [Clostridia bacterium]
MKCDNCGRNEATVKYSENINGVKRNLNLCHECSEKLGINKMSFNIPIGISDFFGGFFDDFETDGFEPFLAQARNIKCNNCGITFDDIINTGKLGCGECYETFESKIAPLMREIQGSNKHEGRLGKSKNTNLDFSNKIESDKENDEILELKEQLKKAIKDERYEDAAKIRDEIAKKEK